MVKSMYCFTRICIDLQHAAHLYIYIPVKSESQVGFYDIQISSVLQTTTKCMASLMFWICVFITDACPDTAKWVWSEVCIALTSLQLQGCHFYAVITHNPSWSVACYLKKPVDECARLQRARFCETDLVWAPASREQTRLWRALSSVSSPLTTELGSNAWCLPSRHINHLSILQWNLVLHSQFSP